MGEYKIYDKSIIITVIELEKNRVYEIRDVLVAVYDILYNTEYGALKDYELEGKIDIYNWLVEKRWAKYWVGSRMAKLYDINEDKRKELEEFQDYLYDYLDKKEDEE